MFSLVSAHLSVILILLAFCQTGTCLECYACSPITGNCEDPFNVISVSTAPCDGLQDVCTKTGTVGKISRNCGVRDTCHRSENCYACTNNLCNSSSDIMPSFVTSSFVLLLFTKYFV